MVALMLTLSSTPELLSSLKGARDVSLIAYTLPAGRVIDGLTAAAKAGAHVHVRLEGYIYKDDGSVAAANAAAIALLRAAGADAQLELDFLAKDVYLVLGGHGQAQVTASGSPSRTIDVDGGLSM